jgi:hypothetical protein
MAADYTKTVAAGTLQADDRLRLPDERHFRGLAYVNDAQRSGLPLPSRRSTRGRPV